MASQLHVPSTRLSSPWGSSKPFKTATSRSPSLTLTGHGPWSPKLESFPRQLRSPAVSRAPPPLNLTDDSFPLDTNGRLKVPEFVTSDVAITDLCDSNKPLLANGELRALQPIFKIYGQCPKFAGPVVTLKMADDNLSVWELVHMPGNGRVLLIDAGGQMKCAVIGGILSEAACHMGWAGVVVNGCIRDVDEINTLEMGVRALASHPVKPIQKVHGQKHIPVNIAGAFIHDGEWLYADNNGILVSKFELDIYVAHKYKVDFEARHSIKHKTPAHVRFEGFL